MTISPFLVSLFQLILFILNWVGGLVDFLLQPKESLQFLQFFCFINISIFENQKKNICRKKEKNICNSICINYFCIKFATRLHILDWIKSASGVQILALLVYIYFPLMLLEKAWTNLFFLPPAMD